MNDAETNSRPPRAWARTLIAAVAGVAVSVAASIFLSQFVSQEGTTIVVGLVVGAIVAGLILRARGWRGWLGATALVFAAQWVLGLVLTILFVARA